MTSTTDVRQPELVREELNDLIGYLRALPDELKQNGAFGAYDHRAAELSRELIFGEMERFARTTPQLGQTFVKSPTGEYHALQKCLENATQQYQRRAEQLFSTTRVLSWTALIVTTGSLLSAVSPLASLVIPLTAVSASLVAALSCFRFSERARTNQQLADQFDTLRNEIAHSFGPAGEVLGPAEYYPASTKRIEELIEEIQRGTVVESSHDVTHLGR